MSSTRFVRRSGIFFCLIALVFAAGCASSGRSNSNRQIEDTAIREMGTCLKSTPRGNLAQCARQLYSLLNSRLSDSDPDKVPLLISATKMLTLFTRFDRGELTSKQEWDNGLDQISNELKLDQQRARYYSAAQSEMESRRIRQMFQEAERLLSPTNGNLRTCRPAPGYSPGTMVCQ
jgi:hypothetical protein